MERIDAIWKHPEYQKLLHEICLLEKDRIFCRHNPEHFLDVARLAYIYAMEEGLSIEKEIIYATALLHDIGRGLQYTQGIPHEQASAKLAEPILRECGFQEEEIHIILNAILGHRTKDQSSPFGSIIYRADKKSRSCFLCPAEKECDWPAYKKNLSIQS